MTDDASTALIARLEKRDEPGPPIRISDVMAFTGLSRDTIFAALERGDLQGFRPVHQRGSPWLFERAIVVQWWDSIKFASEKNIDRST